MKPFHKAHSSAIFNLTITGVFLALSLIFFLLSHQKFFTWPIASSIGLKIDLSTLFILPIFVSASIAYGIVALIIRFILGPFLNPSISLEIDYFGNFILLFSSCIFIFLFLSFRYVFGFKKEAKTQIITEDYKYKFDKKQAIKLMLNLLVSTFITSIILTIFNAFFFTPVFFKLFKLTDNINPIDLAQQWLTNKKFKSFSLSLNYFVWAFVLYFPFNLVNFTITSILFYGIYLVMIKSHSKMKKSFKY
ncbi:MPN527 family putative ECF transporter permease subunit [Mesomycoplasma hyorhinis]|uniref:MPN527 family putative ECF transporter permease subunit n=1 Tax=Mesomycoplasma hyorhinis TaxID=2100 RepID=UPI001C052565|nr:hypothetical protein [Mesomycoplasma hyorhinis]